MSDGLRDYLDLVTGITEATTAKAKSVAAELLNSGVEWGTKGHTTVMDLADDLVTTGRDNREALITLIHAEFEKMTAQFGLTTDVEISALVGRVTQLEAELESVKVEVAEVKGAAATPKRKSSEGSKKSAKKSKKNSASKNTAKKNTAKKGTS